MVCPADCSDGRALSLVPKVSWRSAYEYVDLFAVSPTEPTITGAVLTIIIVIAWLISASFSTVEFVHPRPIVTHRQRWTTMAGPDAYSGNGVPLFPTRVRCAARGGCAVWQAFSNKTERSRACAVALQAAAAPICHNMSVGDTHIICLCYSDVAGDGLRGGCLGGDGGACLEMWNVNVMEWNEAHATPMGFWNPLPIGASQLTYVRTTNATDTSSLGAVRDEWYPLVQASAPFAHAGGADNWEGYCSALAAHFSDASLVAALAASWTDVSVETPRELLELAGTIGGTWELLLLACGAALVLTRLISQGQQRLAKSHKWPAASRREHSPSLHEGGAGAEQNADYGIHSSV